MGPELALGAAGAGSLVGGYLGYLGAKKQADAYKDAAKAEAQARARFESYGAPYREGLEALYTPEGINAWLSGPEVQGSVDEGTNALARALSVKTGNPFGSPAAQAEIQKYATNSIFSKLGQERERLAGFGGLTQFAGGATQYNPALDMGAINSLGNQYGSLAFAAGGLGQAGANYFNPQPTLYDYLYGPRGGSSGMGSFDSSGGNLA